LNIFELGGIYMRGLCYPGLNKKDVVDLCSDIIIGEKE
jgi:hypothetical protein